MLHDVYLFARLGRNACKCKFAILEQLSACGSSEESGAINGGFSRSGALFDVETVGGRRRNLREASRLPFYRVCLFGRTTVSRKGAHCCLVDAIILLLCPLTRTLENFKIVASSFRECGKLSDLILFPENTVMFGNLLSLYYI